MKSLIKLNSNEKPSGFPEFPTLFDDFFTRDFFNFRNPNIYGNTTMPAVNVKETHSSYELEMAIPGMEKKDFKIELEQDTLFITLEKENKTEEKSDDGKYYRKEFNYQSFKRSFRLPENSIDENNINATYTDGILHVSVPKKEALKLKTTKEIRIE